MSLSPALSADTRICISSVGNIGDYLDAMSRWLGNRILQHCQSLPAIALASEATKESKAAGLFAGLLLPQAAFAVADTSLLQSKLQAPKHPLLPKRWTCHLNSGIGIRRLDP